MTTAVHGAMDRRRFRIAGTFALLFASFLLQQSFAQVSSGVSSISPADAISDTPLIMSVELQRGELIEHVYLVYRPFGESQWHQQEMELLGNTARTKLTADALIPIYLDYYIVLAYRSGTLESYPLNDSPNPLTYPPTKTLQLPVKSKEDDQQVFFLSPEPNTTFEAADVLISVSLLRVDSVVVRRAIQVLLDGADVSQYAVLSEDILVYVPDNHGLKLKPGRHKVSVLLFNRSGNLHRQISTSFNVIGEGEALQAPGSVFRYNGTLDLEARAEKVSEVRTHYNRGGARFSGAQGDWRFNTNLFVTSDESPDRQPQNRYYVSLESPWLLVGYGDSYPNFPNLILNGKRVRGLNSSLRLGKFNIDLTLGQTVREVEGALLKVIPTSLLGTEQRTDPFAAYARIDSSSWGKYNYGTYSRNLFAIRPSFGSGETYQIGFTWLKSKDDMSSIRFGARPQENLVIGTDMISKFDKNRIELTGQVAFSAYNSDISSGNFTDAYIDSVYTKDAASIKNARDILKNFITVNDNLRPLSFKKLSTLAYETALSLNYFDNTLKTTYLYRGSDYNSFGQTFLRKDIAGFNFLDHIRLLTNTLFVTLGYERLTDNTSNAKAITTRFVTYNVAVNYSPHPDLPNFSAGYTLYVNTNDFTPLGPDSISAVDDQTNRLYFLASQRFSLLATHTASLSVSTSTRDDHTVRNLDVKNASVSLNLNSRYVFPFQTVVGYTINLNKFPSSIPGTFTEINYSVLFLSGRYSLFNETLAVGATCSPMFGDVKRLALDFNAQWTMTQQIEAFLQYSYFHNDGGPNDDFWSLKFRYDI